MIKRIFRIVGYLILFAINGCLLWFFHGFLNLAIMVVMVFLPIFSIVATKWVANRLDYHWEGPYESMHKGQEFLIRLQLLNPTWLGVMNCQAEISVTNLLYGTTRLHSIRVPIRGKKGQTVTYPVTVSKCGNIEFRIQKVVLGDFLGFVTFRKNFPEPYVAVVLPEEQVEIETDLNGYTLGMEEVEESTQKGTDFSEVQDVREYQPGDKMQNIHWKLSVKKDILMVKERVSMSSKQLFLLIELHDNGNGLLEEVFDCTYGIVKFMHQNHLPVSLVWWSKKMQELMIWKADTAEQLDEGFRMMFYEELYEENTLGREMLQAIRGNEIQFLWVGDRNSGTGEAFMDFGIQAGVYYGI